MSLPSSASGARQPRLLALLLFVALLLLSLSLPVRAQSDTWSAARQAQWLALEPPPPATPPASTVGSEAPTAIEGLDEWSTLAYQSYRDGNWEIYVAKGDNGGARRLTTHGASDLRPDLNRGATKIVFVSTRDGDAEIFSINVDGSGLTQLTSNDTVDRDPRWSPDGTRIVYSAQSNNDQSLFIMNADGSGRYRLTSGAQADLMPSWSPDGQFITWVRVVDGSRGQLMLVRPDGGGLSALGYPLKYMQNPSWFPMGEAILLDAATGDDWNDLLSYSAASGFRIHLNEPVGRTDLLAGAVSPNGAKIAFTRVRYEIQGGQLVVVSMSLERIDMAGGYPSPIGWFDNAPRWERHDVSPPHTQMAPLGPFTRAAAVRPTWSGSDVGAAGLVGFDVQSRSGSGPWETRSYGAAVRTDFFSGPAGTQMAFRVRGRDDAGNVEPWPAEAETVTTLFTWKLDGTISDSRGVPLPSLPVSVSPAPLDPPATSTRGAFSAHLTSENQPHTLGASRAGYGAVPGSKYVAHSDIDAFLYLPGPETVLPNGGFESAVPFEGWQSSGTLPSTWAGVPHSGIWSAQLGDPCVAGCLESHSLPSGMQEEIIGSTLDRDGRLHIVWERYSGSTETYHYSFQRADGSWAPPELLPLPLLAQAQLSVGPQGHVHLMDYAGGSTQQPRGYAERSPSGSWSAPDYFLFPNDYSLMEVDEASTVHHLYTYRDSANRYYVYRNKALGGGWSSPVVIATRDSSQLSGQVVAAMREGTLYVAWSEPVGNQATETRYYLRSRSPQGDWTPREMIHAAPVYTENPVGMLAGENGHLYLAVGTRAFLERNAGGEWLPRRSFPSGSYFRSWGVDGDGALHLLTDGAYLVRRGSRDWLTVAPVPRAVNGARVHLDGAGRATLVGMDWSLMQRAALAGAAGDATISAPLTVPATMGRPTVALTFRQEQTLPGAASHLELAVQDGAGTTVLYEGQGSHWWGLAWGDLTPWRGQSVTLHIRLRQDAADIPSRLYVDNVTVSDWLTPVVSAAEPDHILTGWVGQSVTLHGDNFYGVPQLWVGGVPIPSVQRLDQQTLRIVLPTTLGPGRHDIRVRDGAGRESIAPQALELGASLFTPFIHR